MTTIHLHNFGFANAQIVAVWRIVWEECYIARWWLQVLILVVFVLGTGGSRS